MTFFSTEYTYMYEKAYNYIMMSYTYIHCVGPFPIQYNHWHTYNICTCTCIRYLVHIHIVSYKYIQNKQTIHTARIKQWCQIEVGHCMMRQYWFLFLCLALTGGLGKTVPTCIITIIVRIYYNYSN